MKGVDPMECEWFSDDISASYTEEPEMALFWRRPDGGGGMFTDVDASPEMMERIVNDHNRLRDMMTAKKDGIQ